MNIWAWVQAKKRELQQNGNGRLAELMEALPTAVCDDAHEIADAMVPEALSLARALGETWVEVFIRHWDLQSRVLHRYEGASALNDAALLLDLAHSEPAVGCPQAVCAVQDLCNAYDNLDGAGYREERLATATEALARIDATWSCYECIHSEHASAYLDGATPQEQLAYIDAYVLRRTQAGTRNASYELRGERVSALVDMGQYEEAFAFNQRASHLSYERSKRMRARIDTARLHALLGRPAEASAALPEWSEVEGTASFYWLWARALKQLVEHLARPNDAVVDEVFQKMVSKLEAIGNARRGFQLAEWHALLEIAAGNHAAAAGAIAAMERNYVKLRRPLGATETLANARAALREARAASGTP